MSNDGITRYVVTVKFHDETLTDINELNNHFTRAGFLITMADEDGKVHDLGTNTFGLVSALNEQEVHELASGLAESAVGQKTDVKISTWENWQHQEQ
ncbi:type V toxin-antitoxin system endoribonuclease antitoxin GhoS [Kosakonia sp. SMBL-WEM22]|uniref:type V toxin-antitoxin system endoribonuclease antitoxin GhoS n=1 Tax=Kosakonia sp. SMBL-WEM22 TaxID=2725560 RepID=UPI0016590E18|nr:type V toxin-antitoxin system endoribonuclease antitoxin GhoS [Kosakonia sp. SMBL-WEM22]MDV5356347.1 type V toxin-antitoxin system endoribonuclease antitoxin GhoS [Enterobacter asburiae]QNQ20110.1 type V toxin-antitoxin system endoribonuclease antitoxin GhoS [Kosakonia sp. SMBL-WEM22]